MIPQFQKPIYTTKTARLNTIYLHMMKCGGSSVHSVLKPYSNAHITHGQGFFIIQDTPNPHIEYGYTDYAAAHWAWTVIREPFSRLAAVQTVFNNRHGGRIPMDKFLSIAARPGMAADRSKGIYSMHEIWTHSRPYTWYPIHRMDYIGIFEQMDKVWATVQEYLGITEPLPHLNQSGFMGDPLRLFTPAQQALVRELYSDDFLLYEAVTENVK